MLRPILSATVLMSALLATPAIAEEIKMPRTISLTGHGEVRVAPDLVVVTVGVMSQGATAAEALSTNTASMNAVFETLKTAGIEAKDIQTSNFMVQPRYDYDKNTQPPKLVGYDVSNNVTITVRQIDALGSLLDKLVTAGSNQIQGVMFQVAKPDAALDVARKLATEDATRKAKLYAGAMGVSIGQVLSISEGVHYERPMQTRMKTSAAPMAEAVPIAAGEQVLSVDVNIAWEIQ
jgi:uncharacterized protein YggE